jgi:MFS family permease
MFLSTILLALIVGALAGGGLPRLADLRLRWTLLLVAALALRLGASLSREADVLADVPVGWAYLAAYGLIFVWLWGNWRVPGLQIASVGIGANMLAVIANAGQMPIWSAAYNAAGFTPADIANDPFHFILRADSVGEFVASGGLFGDVIPLPLPYVRDVVSIGDLLLALGIFWAIVYSMTRADVPSRGGIAFGAPGSPGIGRSTPAPALPGTAGGPVAAAARIPAEVSQAGADLAGMRRQSPYLRLVRNRNFSLLWIGQLVSLLGERIHQVAIGFLVLRATGSLADVGLTFAATAIPNLFFGPIAGALVDRWDRRLTMVACDLVRAALVLAVPFAIEIDVALVYLLGFLISTVTLLFRPAKVAAIPDIVESRDLVPANSATSFADGVADLIGFPIAGVIVASLASLELAFAVDAGTYVISGVLIAMMTIGRTTPAPVTPLRPAALWAEIVEGWRFLRRQPELFGNTVLSAVAQLAVGAEIAVVTPYADLAIDRGALSAEEAYAWLLAAIAAGSVVTGLLYGAIGERVPKGPVVVAGFVGMGLALAGAGLVDQLWIAMILFFLIGATNMLFIIPTITLFQERTPGQLMGRVVSSRQALVFGSIALAMGLSGFLAELVGPSLVFVGAGAICAVAGMIGILFPAIRDAR